ncbi:MAG: hypothetical protein IIY52_00295 [Solobacterium sp.]|nr:hypothetical protein [Solobacterium sp.]
MTGFVSFTLTPTKYLVSGFLSGQTFVCADTFSEKDSLTGDPAKRHSYLCEEKTGTLCFGKKAGNKEEKTKWH